MVEAHSNQKVVGPHSLKSRQIKQRLGNGLKWFKCKMAHRQRNITHDLIHSPRRISSKIELLAHMSNTPSGIFDSFPPEIMAHIFLYTRLYCLRLNQPESITRPPEFTQVCSRWRSIAHSLPELWTALTIGISRALETEADASSFESVIIEWISRSSNLPIDLTICDSKLGASKFQWDLYAQIYRKITFDFSGKWRSIKLPFAWHTKDFVRVIYPARLPVLEELTLRPMIPSLDAVLSPQAPHLNKLILCNIWEKAMGFSIPYIAQLIPKTINDLTLSSSDLFSHSSISGFLILGPLQRLTHLCISRFSWDSPQPLPSITMPKLRDLSLEASPPAIADLLNALGTPLLERLDIQVYGSKEYYGLASRLSVTIGPALLGFYQRSRFPVSKFSLDLTLGLNREFPPPISFERFFPFLSAVSTTLNVLDITILRTELDTISPLLVFLCYDKNKVEGRILPHLEVVSLDDPDCEFPACLDARSCKTFMKSRWWATDPRPRPSGLPDRFKLQIGKPGSEKASQLLELNCCHL